MKRLLKRLARASGLSQAWRGFRDARRRRKVERARQDPISKERLEEDLRRLGLGPGDCVMVHSSLSALGFVEGGAQTVIRSLLGVIGEQGTLVMPAYSIGDFSIEALKRAEVFDPAAAPSLMGKISETFRLWPGTQRSVHYTHSCCALGPQAAFIVRDHEAAVTPAGPGSPIARLLELGGRVLALGSSFGHITFFHVIEDMMTAFPVPVYYPELMTGRIKEADGTIRNTHYRVHDPAIYLAGRIDLDKKKEAEILGHFRRHGIVREGPAGGGHAILFGAREATDLLIRLAEEGITIYKRNPLHKDGRK